MAEAAAMVEIPEGSGVLLDELGSVPLVTMPAAERAVLLELGGRLNKQEKRWSGKFMMSSAQAAELVADVVASAIVADPAFMVELDKQMKAAFRRVRDGG